jgi:hypothetical protein
MDLKETEAKNDCAGEGQQQFNRLTAVNDRLLVSIRIKTPYSMRQYGIFPFKCT